MIDTLIDHLEQKNIDKDHLHTEHFISSSQPAVILEGAGQDSNVKVHLHGQEISVKVPPSKTILDVLIENKFDPPYSCTSGACSTCIAKLVNGEVSMDACYALDDDEVKEGYILVCQSRARSPEVELTFET
jgi:Ferredoxin